MGFTRRYFIKSCVLFGGASLLAPMTGRGLQAGEASWQPGYLRLEKGGKLAERIRQAYAHFENCRLCPRQCGVNRVRGERGFCRAPVRPVVFSYSPHFGEEEPITGVNGSGTIFFSNCNLRCIFCQNWPISHEGRGREISDEDLANRMIELQKMGCHNINLVTPTHVMPNILSATRIALKKGLRLPLFYNTCGYERVEILKILDGIVDIYKPDFKFMDPRKASIYVAGASDYPELTKRAILEMHRQVGELRTDRSGIAYRGLLIRHLVMPNRAADTDQFVAWVAQALPKSTYVNIMAQYRVEYRAYEYPEIARGITAGEFVEAIEWAQKAGLTNLDSKSMGVYRIYRRSRSN
ncbi:MAG: radical SAM protein [Thermodesulfobacteriota bacterium]